MSICGIVHSVKMWCVSLCITKVYINETNTEIIDGAGMPPPLPPLPNAPRGPRGVGLPLHGGRPILEEVILETTCLIVIGSSPAVPSP